MGGLPADKKGCLSYVRHKSPPPALQAGRSAVRAAVSRARTALRLYVPSRTCAENLRAGPARVPQDAAFPEKQKADRPRRGVMRPEPPHRAGFLCRLPVFRVLTAWQAKGRPKSVRFCADYKKAGGFTPSASGTAARRKALSGLRAGGRLLRTGQGGLPRGPTSSKRANGRLQSIAFLRAVAEPLWRRFRAPAHIGGALSSFEKAVDGSCSKAFFGRTAYRPPKGRPVCRSLIQPVALRLYSALPWMGWRSAGVKVPVRALKRHSGSCPSEKCQYSV